MTDPMRIFVNGAPLSPAGGAPDGWGTCDRPPVAAVPLPTPLPRRQISRTTHSGCWPPAAGKPTPATACPPPATRSTRSTCRLAWRWRASSPATGRGRPRPARLSMARRASPPRRRRWRASSPGPPWWRWSTRPPPSPPFPPPPACGRRSTSGTRGGCGAAGAPPVYGRRSTSGTRGGCGAADAPLAASLPSSERWRSGSRAEMLPPPPPSRGRAWSPTATTTARASLLRRPRRANKRC